MKPCFRFYDEKVWLGGVVSDQGDADKLLSWIAALRPLLRPAPVCAGEVLREPRVRWDGFYDANGSK